MDPVCAQNKVDYTDNLPTGDLLSIVPQRSWADREALTNRPSSTSDSAQFGETNTIAVQDIRVGKMVKFLGLGALNPACHGTTGAAASGWLILRTVYLSERQTTPTKADPTPAELVVVGGAL